MKVDSKELVVSITDYVNSFGDKSAEFNSLMENEHRTLQQSFTKLALSWIEHVASVGYRTDPRNEGSQVVCMELLRGFRESQENAGYTGSNLELMAKPSGHLRCI